LDQELSGALARRRKPLAAPRLGDDADRSEAGLLADGDSLADITLLRCEPALFMLVEPG